MPCGSACSRTACPAPALVHCQWGNHEVGTLQPVHQVVALCRDAGVTVHVDAAAACGHVPTDLRALDADLVSVSAHKLGGVPGAGALIVRRGSRFDPLLVGGEQERGRRAGLEPIPALLAFGAAAAALAAGGGAVGAEAATARRRIAAVVEAALAVDGVEVVGPASPGDRLPHLVCLGVHGVEAEPVLIGLDRAGVAVHSGSACSSESIEPSPVLEAMGVDPSHSLRVSVGWTTTDADCAAFAGAFRVSSPTCGRYGADDLTSRDPRPDDPTTGRERRRDGSAALVGPATKGATWGTSAGGGSSARKSLNWATAAGSL